MVNRLAVGEFMLEYLRVADPLQSLLLNIRDMILSLESCYQFFSSLRVQCIGFTIQQASIWITFRPQIQLSRLVESHAPEALWPI